jgi:transcriptional antiterminator NusG
MEMKWYVLHTLSGQENKVKDSLERRIRLEEMKGIVGDVLVPTEKVSEVKQGKRTTQTRKFFPGYVLVNALLYNDDGTLHEPAWDFFTNQKTQGIIGFIGGDKPVPLKQSEIDHILYQVEDKEKKVKPKVSFEPGETVKVNDGPFLNFTGVIEEVDPTRGKLKISVSIFGRTAPVEIEYWQVEKA